jgi:hypothetical protein
LNAANIQVGGTATGIPTVVAPNIGALTSASNITGAAAKTADLQASSNNDHPSVIIVEFLGFGGGDGSDQPNPVPERNSQDSTGPVQVLGAGQLTPAQQMQLTDTERRHLAEP